MNQEPSVHSIADERLDREIESALAIDPSPEFLVRVRARVAEERLARPLKLWVVSAMAAAAGVAVTTMIVWQPREPHVPTVPTQIEALPDTRNEPLSLGSQASASSTPKPAKAKEGGSSGVASGPAPEVLISAGEAAALRQLFGGITQGRIEPSLLPPIVPSGPLVPIDEIHIELIAVETSQ